MRDWAQKIASAIETDGDRHRSVYNLLCAVSQRLTDVLATGGSVAEFAAELASAAPDLARAALKQPEPPSSD